MSKTMTATRVLNGWFISIEDTISVHKFSDVQNIASRLGLTFKPQLSDENRKMFQEIFEEKK